MQHSQVTSSAVCSGDTWLGKSHRREDVNGTWWVPWLESLSRKGQRAPPAPESITGVREAGTSPCRAERVVSDTQVTVLPPTPPQQGRHEDRPWAPQAQDKGKRGQSQSITTGAGATAVFPGRSTLPATPPGRALGLGPRDCDVPGSEVQRLALVQVLLGLSACSAWAVLTRSGPGSLCPSCGPAFSEAPVTAAAPPGSREPWLASVAAATEA